MGKLFGTDGIRGVANTFLTAETAYKLGRASAYMFTKKTNQNSENPGIVIGTDTRASCDMLNAAFTAGACSVGAHVIDAGIIPTPALPILIRKHGFNAGIVISASHNPCEDNGLKLFDSNGFKLPDSLEDEIESIMTDDNTLTSLPHPVGTKIGRKEYLPNAVIDYAEALIEAIGNISLKGLKIAVDCANGAVFKAAPLVLARLGADVKVINDQPDGGNINLNCGSTHMDAISRFVREANSDIGLSFDGDGDRLLAADENGKIVNGDQIMSICANHLKQERKLNKNTVAATVMSNLGFLQMGERQGINIVQTKVGDRYVLEEMLKNGYNFGGEQSGHIIFLDYNTTGDGLLTALMLLKILSESKNPFSSVNNYMTILPQSLINVKVSDERKNSYSSDEKVIQAVKEVESELKKIGGGRVLLRASGTEPCVRVMLESLDLFKTEILAQKIADAVRTS